MAGSGPTTFRGGGETVTQGDTASPGLAQPTGTQPGVRGAGRDTGFSCRGRHTHLLVYSQWFSVFLTFAFFLYNCRRKPKN